MPRTVFRACTLCEATCGLAFEVEGERILSVGGDASDPLSRGFICPKGVAIADVHHDPDRLRRPVRRTATGRFEPIAWDDAFDLVARRLNEIRIRHGRDAVAFYWGNPSGQNHGALLLINALTQALGTRNRFSAGSQDANPRVVVSYWLFGSGIAIPVPDIDRTDYFLCLGANPVVSNGSVMTAPDLRTRLRAIRERGGKIVIVDPRRTESAKEASEHVAIRPGGDAALLLAMVHVLAARGRVARAFLERATTGWPDIQRRLGAFSPERAAPLAGVPAETIERLALEFSEAKAAVAYSRVGVCVAPHATLATYATDLLNIVTGRIGSEGGWMFPTPAFELGTIARLSGLDGHGRWRSRVRGLPETAGDLPAATLADEIETPGPGQVRGMVTFAGNPVLSLPNGRRLAKALEGLDFHVAVDIYVNETTRQAHVILPPCWSLAEDHVNLLFSQLSVRNFARWSPPVVAKGRGERADWEILAELTERLGGGPMGTPWLDRLLRLVRPVGLRFEPTAVADLLLRLGPYGDRFLPWSNGLSMRRLRAAPHGIDLGPLVPGYERRIYHRDRRIHLAPPPILDALAALDRDLDTQPETDALVLIGRRELRSNNSWMHNVGALVSGRHRCVLLVHPDDARRRAIRDGDFALLESRVHRGPVLVRTSADMRPGVVSLPHGWGHGDSAPWQRVAGERPGVSANDWTDDSVVEPVIAQSILNGVPVRLAKLPPA